MGRAFADTLPRRSDLLHLVDKHEDLLQLVDECKSVVQRLRQSCRLRG